MIQRYYVHNLFLNRDIAGDYVLYEDFIAELGFKESELTEKDAEIGRLSAIINRQHDDCEHLQTKLENKKWETQLLDQEIKRLKIDLEKIKFCSSGQHAAQIAEEALKERGIE